MTVLGHIPTYTHMELSCAISDTLYEKCTLALEPYYDRDFFIYSLLINKPNFVPASTGFWTKLCDQYAFFNVTNSNRRRVFTWRRILL